MQGKGRSSTSCEGHVSAPHGVFPADSADHLHPVGNSSPSDAGQYLCIECSETFDSKVQLNNHRQSHVAKKPFMCSHCGRGFHHQIFLQMHERSHEGGSPHNHMAVTFPKPSTSRVMSTRRCRSASSSLSDMLPVKPNPPKSDSLVNSLVEFRKEKKVGVTVVPIECVTRLGRGRAPTVLQRKDSPEKKHQFELRIAKFSEATVQLIDPFGNSFEILTEVFNTYTNDEPEERTLKMSLSRPAPGSQNVKEPMSSQEDCALRISSITRSQEGKRDLSYEVTVNTALQHDIEGTSRLSSQVPQVEPKVFQISNNIYERTQLEDSSSTLEPSTVSSLKELSLCNGDSASVTVLPDSRLSQDLSADVSPCSSSHNDDDKPLGISQNDSMTCPRSERDYLSPTAQQMEVLTDLPRESLGINQAVSSGRNSAKSCIIEDLIPGESSSSQAPGDPIFTSPATCLPVQHGPKLTTVESTDSISPIAADSVCMIKAMSTESDQSQNGTLNGSDVSSQEMFILEQADGEKCIPKQNSEIWLTEKNAQPGTGGEKLLITEHHQPDVQLDKEVETQIQTDVDSSDTTCKRDSGVTVPEQEAQCENIRVNISLHEQDMNLLAQNRPLERSDGNHMTTPKSPSDVHSIAHDALTDKGGTRDLSIHRSDLDVSSSGQCADARGDGDKQTVTQETEPEINLCVPDTWVESGNNYLFTTRGKGLGTGLSPTHKDGPGIGLSPTPKEDPTGGLSPAPTEDPAGGLSPAPTEDPATGGLSPDPTEDPATGGLSPAPTEDPATGGLSPAPTEDPATGGLSPAPTEDPATGGLSPAPTEDPATGGLSPAPTEDPATGGLSPAPTEDPATGGLSPAPTEDPAIGGLSPAPTEDPAIGGLSPAPTEDPAIGGLSPAPTEDPAIGGLSPAPTEDLPTGGLSPAPTEDLPTGGLSPAPTEDLPTGGLSPAPTEDLPTGGLSPAPTEDPATGGLSPAPTEDPATGGLSPAPTEDPATGGLSPDPTEDIIKVLSSTPQEKTGLSYFCMNNPSVDLPEQTIQSEKDVDNIIASHKSQAPLYQSKQNAQPEKHKEQANINDHELEIGLAEQDAQTEGNDAQSGTEKNEPEIGLSEHEAPPEMVADNDGSRNERDTDISLQEHGDHLQASGSNKLIAHKDKPSHVSSPENYQCYDQTAKGPAAASTTGRGKPGEVNVNTQFMTDGTPPSANIDNLDNISSLAYGICGDQITKNDSPVVSFDVKERPEEINVKMQFANIESSLRDIPVRDAQCKKADGDQLTADSVDFGHDNEHSLNMKHNQALTHDEKSDFHSREQERPSEIHIEKKRVTPERKPNVGLFEYFLESEKGVEYQNLDHVSGLEDVQYGNQSGSPKINTLLNASVIDSEGEKPGIIHPIVFWEKPENTLVMEEGACDKMPSVQTPVLETNLTSSDDRIIDQKREPNTSLSEQAKESERNIDNQPLAHKSVGVLSHVVDDQNSDQTVIPDPNPTVRSLILGKLTETVVDEQPFCNEGDKDQTHFQDDISPEKALDIQTTCELNPPSPLGQCGVSKTTQDGDSVANKPNSPVVCERSVATQVLPGGDLDILPDKIQDAQLPGNADDQSETSVLQNRRPDKVLDGECDAVLCILGDDPNERAAESRHDDISHLETSVSSPTETIPCEILCSNLTEAENDTHDESIGSPIALPLNVEVDKQASTIDSQSAVNAPCERSVLKETDISPPDEEVQPQESESRIGIYESTSCEPCTSPSSPASGELGLHLSINCFMCGKQVRRKRKEQSSSNICFKCSQSPKSREPHSTEDPEESPGLELWQETPNKTVEMLPLEFSPCHIKKEADTLGEELADELRKRSMTSVQNNVKQEAPATTSSKVYKCPKCNKSFRLPVLLAGHMKHFHMLPRCVTCGCQISIRCKLKRIPKRCQKCVQQTKELKREFDDDDDSFVQSTEEDSEKSVRETNFVDSSDTPIAQLKHQQRVRRVTKPLSTEPSNIHKRRKGLSTQKRDLLLERLDDNQATVSKVYKCLACGVTFERYVLLIKHLKDHSQSLFCNCYILFRLGKKQLLKKCKHCREHDKDQTNEERGLPSLQRLKQNTGLAEPVTDPPASLRQTNTACLQQNHSALSDTEDTLNRSSKMAKHVKESNISLEQDYDKHIRQGRGQRKSPGQAALNKRTSDKKLTSLVENPGDYIDQDESVTGDSLESSALEGDMELLSTGRMTDELELKLHDTDNKPYICQFCGKCFQFNRYLQLHLVVHTRIPCESCGYRFRNKRGAGRRSKRCRLCRIKSKLQGVDDTSGDLLAHSSLTHTKIPKQKGIASLQAQHNKQSNNLKSIKSQFPNKPRKNFKGTKGLILKGPKNKLEKNKVNLIQLQEERKKKLIKIKNSSERSSSRNDPNKTLRRNSVSCGEGTLIKPEGSDHTLLLLDEARLLSKRPHSGDESLSGLEETQGGMDRKNKACIYGANKAIKVEEDEAVSSFQIPPTPDIKEEPNLSDTPQMNQCFECGQNFPYKYLLFAHYKIHSTSRPFICTQCPQRFYTRQQMESHVQVHTKDRPYCCPECDKSFIQINHLNIHRRVHTGIRPYNCPHCTSSFRNKASLIIHRYSHSNMQPLLMKPHKCSVCYKTFEQLDDLVVHGRSHTEGRSFPCKDCDKIFPSKSRLASHSKSHTDQGPYSCPTCKRVFSYKANMLRHHLKHTGEKTFSCSKCGASFARQELLARHKLKHGKKGVFSCAHCKKSFQLLICFLKHQKLCKAKSKRKLVKGQGDCLKPRKKVKEENYVVNTTVEDEELDKKLSKAEISKSEACKAKPNMEEKKKDDVNTTVGDEREKKLSKLETGPGLACKERKNVEETNVVKDTAVGDIEKKPSKSEKQKDQACKPWKKLKVGKNIVKAAMVQEKKKSKALIKKGTAFKPRKRVKENDDVNPTVGEGNEKKPCKAAIKKGLACKRRKKVEENDVNSSVEEQIEEQPNIFEISKEPVINPRKKVEKNNTVKRTIKDVKKKPKKVEIKKIQAIKPRKKLKVEETDLVNSTGGETEKKPIKAEVKKGQPCKPRKKLKVEENDDVNTSVGGEAEKKPSKAKKGQTCKPRKKLKVEETDLENTTIEEETEKKQSKAEIKKGQSCKPKKKLKVEETDLENTTIEETEKNRGKAEVKKSPICKPRKKMEVEENVVDTTLGEETDQKLSKAKIKKAQVCKPRKKSEVEESDVTTTLGEETVKKPSKAELKKGQACKPRKMLEVEENDVVDTTLGGETEKKLSKAKFKKGQASKPRQTEVEEIDAVNTTVGEETVMKQNKAEIKKRQAHKSKKKLDGDESDDVNTTVEETKKKPSKAELKQGQACKPRKKLEIEENDVVNPSDVGETEKLQSKSEMNRGQTFKRMKMAKEEDDVDHVGQELENKLSKAVIGKGQGGKSRKKVEGNIIVGQALEKTPSKTDNRKGQACAKITKEIIEIKGKTQNEETKATDKFKEEKLKGQKEERHTEGERKKLAVGQQQKNKNKRPNEGNLKKEIEKDQPKVKRTKEDGAACGGEEKNKKPKTSTPRKKGLQNKNLRTGLNSRYKKVGGKEKKLLGKVKSRAQKRL